APRRGTPALCAQANAPDGSVSGCCSSGLSSYLMSGPFDPVRGVEHGGEPDRQLAAVGQDQAPATTSARSAGGLTIMRGTSYRSTELASGGRCRVSPHSTGYTDTSCPAAQASPSG